MTLNRDRTNEYLIREPPEIWLFEALGLDILDLFKKIFKKIGEMEHDR